MLEEKSKFCQHCGGRILLEAEVCPNCGVRVKEQEKPVQQIKNPGIAAVLSFFYVGLGQIYNGQIGKGILFLILGVIFMLLMFVLIGFILYPIFWICNIFDAYRTAEKINKGEEK